MTTDTVDVLVIGGGPAGSTTAAILRKYNPELRVVVVEQAAFPRYHIGESLVLEVNRILHDMDAFAAVDGAGFLRKAGASYVWGRDREPWAFLFSESTGRRPHFEGMVDYTFHVERARFDAILLDCARAHGAEILQPAQVVDLVMDGPRVAGAEVELAGGGRRSIAARFVVDASGRRGVVAQRFGRREWDPVLRNLATFGYFRGARLEPAHSRDWAESTIAIVTLPTGWLWYIPMEPGVVSVGAVRPAGPREDGERDPEATLRRAIASAPEPARWLADAELVRFHGAPRLVMVERDFNYFHDHLWGDGYALVGDAAGFLDPLFTFGVFLSMTGAQLLAYALGTALGGGFAEATLPRVLAAYEQHMRGYFDAFRAMLYTFYAYNGTKEELWAGTRDLVRSQGLPEDLGDRDAFMATIFGFGVNTPLFREASGHFGHVAQNRIRDMLLGGRATDVRLSELGDFAMQALPDGARPRIVAPFAVHESAVPIDGTGRVVPMTRVDFAVPGREGPGFPRHFFVPDPWLGWLARVDGRRSVGDIVEGARALPVPRYLRHLRPEELVRHTLQSMVKMRVAEVAQ